MENIFKRAKDFVKELRKSPEESMSDYLESLQTKDPILRNYEIKKSELVRMSKDWRKKAKEVLSNFVEQNPDKINGYRFYKCYNTSDDPNCNYAIVKRLPNGNFCIEERNPYRGWDSEPEYVDYDSFIEKTGYTSKSLADILLSPTCSEMNHIDNEDNFNNKYRNMFLKKFEKQTGFNLKKEVIEK
jgi:hypothetical protein